jgi:hypothetical protein
MQFYDIFNPQLGGGVVVMTKELNNRAQRYYLSKSTRGASFFIEHPQLFTHLQAGERYQYTETVIGVHADDWHAGLRRYQNWVATWYKPYRSQQDEKAWYRELFWLICDYPDVDPSAMKTPIWYDAATQHYRMRDILDEFTRVAGAQPDLLHFWGWTCCPFQWGIYGEPNYKELGGRENFRAALRDIQDNLKIPVSLYIDAFLCSPGTELCDNLAPTVAFRSQDGTIPHPYSAYHMCQYTKQWQDHMKEVYQRVYRETGAKILYVDEFVTRPEYQCWAKDHGHSVPLNNNEGDYAFLKGLREVLPEELVLYGEHTSSDVISQFWDCVISYYDCAGAAQSIAPTYDQRPAGEAVSVPLVDLYRFVFPRVVQLVLPQGISDSSWHNLKFIFFNGHAHYDSFWDRFESKGQEFMNQAFRIKKEYRDCFSSDSPEMLIPTSQAGLIANKFPGKGRTVWTLYNQRFVTMRGRVLAVDHLEGATYHDAWNGRALEAVIEGGKASLSLELDPQGVGCVVQSLPQ